MNFPSNVKEAIQKEDCKKKVRCLAKMFRLSIRNHTPHYPRKHQLHKWLNQDNYHLENKVWEIARGI